MKISALILAKNEEETLEECLRQLNFVDEIIVLDQFSTDDTIKIAKKYTDKVIQSSKQDFDVNRNILRSKAEGEWLLYIDSDERITSTLREEILTTIKDKKHAAYYIPRENYVLGKRIRHGGWWPDYVPKLFKKNQLIAWNGRVHESPQINGSFGYFKNPLIHYTARSMSKMFQKTIKWAKIEAELSFNAQHSKVSQIKLLKAMVFEFSSRYFKKLGILDGVPGLIEAIYQALHKAIVLTYLWEIQNNTEEKFIKFKKNFKNSEE